MARSRKTTSTNGNGLNVYFGGSLTGRNVALLVAPPGNFTGSASISTSLLRPGGSSGTFVASPILVFWQNFLESRKGRAVPVTPVASASASREAVRRGTAKVK